MTAIEDWEPPAAQFWLRGRHPEHSVGYDEPTGIWNVHGHAEALAVLSDPQTFPSDTGRVFQQGAEFAEGDLVRLDPPAHSRLRKLVSRAFTPKVVAGLEPRIAELTGELLDAAVQRGRLELIEDLAYPLPMIVIAELLGVPSSDRDLFKHWVDGIFLRSQQVSADPTPEQQAELDSALDRIRELAEYLREHVADRERNPRDDLISRLVQSDVDGERLSRAAATDFAVLLLIAGHITTTMLLGNTVLCLDAHPEQLARTRADRSVLPAVIEESLRLLSPFARVGRVTGRAVSLGGREIPADQLVMVHLAAANRDSRVFADPDVFDPARDPNPHLSFGRGVHFCLGAPLARLEGRVALDLLLDRFPVLATDPADPPVFQPNPDLTGVRRLPLRTA